MLSPSFRLFETICSELATQESVVITREDFGVTETQAPLMDELKEEYGFATSEESIESAIKFLQKHFESKGSKLPFEYDAQTGRFTVTNQPFVTFIQEMSSMRSIGKRSRDFEVQVSEWLSRRITGFLHRVGFPRDSKKKAAEFRSHLRTLGFGSNVLLGAEKDGGLDLLWLLPIGSVPHTPIVSVQCKNGVYDLEQADISIGAGSRSLACHLGLIERVHVPCVLFNDYIRPEALTSKPYNFVPLGLSDLSALTQPITLTQL